MSFAACRSFAEQRDAMPSTGEPKVVCQVHAASLIALLLQCVVLFIQVLSVLVLAWVAIIQRRLISLGRAKPITWAVHQGMRQSYFLGSYFCRCVIGAVIPCLKLKKPCRHTGGRKHKKPETKEEEGEGGDGKKKKKKGKKEKGEPKKKNSDKENQ